MLLTLTKEGVGEEIISPLNGSHKYDVADVTQRRGKNLQNVAGEGRLAVGGGGVCNT